MEASSRTIWDFWAPRYERLWAQHFSLRPSRELVHRRIAEVAVGRGRLLDVGCGVGQFLREHAERYPDVEHVGYDPSREMIERARSDYGRPNVSYEVGTLWDVPRAERFDVITCMHAFPYIADGHGALRRMRELLRAGGRIEIIQANADNAYDWAFLKVVALTTTRAHYHSTDELRGLMQRAGLSASDKRGIARPPFIPSIHLVEATA